jgi:hypothetical protein
VLVRFRDGTRADDRAAVDLQIGDRVPLVPELYELAVPAGERVPDAVRKLGDEPDVVYADPDYVVYDETFTTPQDAAYWPNDPYFWPSKYPNASSCKESSRLAQWPLWPLGRNLSDTRRPRPIGQGRWTSKRNRSHDRCR